MEVFARKHGLGAEERFDLKLAATEALTNAFKETPEPVEVTVTGGDGAVTVEVVGGGPFSPRRVVLAREAEAESGRGIALMLALLDDVRFERTPNGTRVRLTKRRRAAGSALRLAG